MYFALYHFVMENGEHTSSWVFSIPYDWLIVSALATTIPFGVMLEESWRGKSAGAGGWIGNVSSLLGSVNSLIEDRVCAARLLVDLPGFIELLDWTGLDTDLDKCEHFARAFLRNWKAVSTSESKHAPQI